MADVLTALEDRLDVLCAARIDAIANAHIVTSWDDYNFRSGFLDALRHVGVMIKQVRNPEMQAGSGEIPSVLEETKNG